MKKSKLNVLITVISLILLCGGILTGCGGDGQGVSGNNAASGNGTGSNIPADVQDLVFLQVAEYSADLGDIYLYLIQYIYNNGITPAYLDDATKASIINGAINQMKLELVEYQLALQSDITLTEEQMMTVDRTSSVFYSTFGGDFLNSYGISEEDVYDLFLRQLYISAITNKAMQDMAAEYTAQYEEDYADLTFHTVYYALFPAIVYDEYTGEPVRQGEGQVIPLAEEELARQLALAEEFQKRAVEGLSSGDAAETMEALVEEYGIAYCSGVERNYDGAYIRELNDVIADMKEGDISEVITTDAGYMIVRMDNTNDEEYKQFMIEYLAYQAANSLLPTMQDAWMQQSGVISAQPDSTAMAAIDLDTLCKTMNELGLTITLGGN